MERMTKQEAAAWKPIIRWRALDMRVLTVARTRIEGSWKAYIRAVDGRSHEDDVPKVLDDGAALDERIARILYPEFDELPYAR